MAVRRDTEELIQVLETHSVAGYPVEDPIFGEAFIVRQEGTGPTRVYGDTGMQEAAPQIVYITRPAHEFSFQDWVQAQHLSREPMSLEEWRKKYEQRMRGEKLPVIYEVLQDLERGEKISEADAEYARLKYGDALGPDDTVLWNSVQANRVSIPPDKLEKGMLVEVEGPGNPEFYGAGRIVGRGKSKDVVLVELFTPVSYWSSTGAIVSEEIQPGFYSANTYSIGYGTRHVMEDNNIPLPPGKLSGYRDREYILEELMPVSEIKKICKLVPPQGSAQEGKPDFCLLQSLIYYILPVNVKGKFHVTFRPLPENVITSEYVVSYDHE